MNKTSNYSPLTIFCGKGGVGKTSMSLAFALRHADLGRRVLVVTSHPLRELAVSVSLVGLKEANPKAAAGLFVIHIDPLEVLAGKVKQIVPSELLVKKVLSSPIYKSLIEVAPGLKEIAFLGRLHQLTEQRPADQSAGKFDLIVWDAPATGHFLQTLKVSRDFQNHLSGPFAVLGKQVADFFSDMSNFSLLPVATLEEMAVEETIELCERLKSELTIKPSGVICNMASPLLGTPDADFEDLQRNIAGHGEESPDLKFIFDRHVIERSLFQKLRSVIKTEYHVVRRIPSWNSDLELLMALSRRMEGLQR